MLQALLFAELAAGQAGTGGGDGGVAVNDVIVTVLHQLFQLPVCFDIVSGRRGAGEIHVMVLTTQFKVELGDGPVRIVARQLHTVTLLHKHFDVSLEEGVHGGGDGGYV